MGLGLCWGCDLLRGGFYTVIRDQSGDAYANVQSGDAYANVCWTCVADQPNPLVVKIQSWCC